MFELSTLSFLDHAIAAAKLAADSLDGVPLGDEIEAAYRADPGTGAAVALRAIGAGRIPVGDRRHFATLITAAADNITARLSWIAAAEMSGETQRRVARMVAGADTTTRGLVAAGTLPVPDLSRRADDADAGQLHSGVQAGDLIARVDNASPVIRFGPGVRLWAPVSGSEDVRRRIVAGHDAGATPGELLALAADTGVSPPTDDPGWAIGRHGDQVVWFRPQELVDVCALADATTAAHPEARAVRVDRTPGRVGPGAHTVTPVVETDSDASTAADAMSGPSPSRSDQ